MPSTMLAAPISAPTAPPSARIAGRVHWFAISRLDTQCFCGATGLAEVNAVHNFLRCRLPRHTDRRCELRAEGLPGQQLPQLVEDGCQVRADRRVAMLLNVFGQIADGGF